MTPRHLIPEMMDDPTLDSSQHFRALNGLQRINRWTGGARLAWGPIRDLAKQLGRKELRILDIATGAADIPLELLRRSERSGLRLSIEACDASPRAVEFARRNARQVSKSLPIFQLDVLRDRIAGEYDVVMCSTFLHHLTDAQAVETLRRMLLAAKHRVIVIDLIRGAGNWWQVWFAAHVLTRSTVVHFDGPQSVRAAFTLPEIRSMATEAGMKVVSLRRVWPCRFVLVGIK